MRRCVWWRCSGSSAPFVLDPLEALAPGAPLANPDDFPESNLEVYYESGRGDVDKGFAESDVVLEFTSRRDLHTYVSPERGCGVWRWNGDYPEVWCKQQRPHIVKRAVASWFGGIPMNRIELHILYQGGQLWGMVPVRLEPGRQLLLGGHLAAHQPAGQMELHPPGGLLRRVHGLRGASIQGRRQEGRDHPGRKG